VLFSFPTRLCIIVGFQVYVYWFIILPYWHCIPTLCLIRVQALYGVWNRLQSTLMFIYFFRNICQFLLKMYIIKFKALKTNVLWIKYETNRQFRESIMTLYYQQRWKSVIIIKLLFVKIFAYRKFILFFYGKLLWYFEVHNILLPAAWLF